MVHKFGHLARRGFTLTELAIVMGVIGVILAAIWAASAQVTAANRSQKGAAQMLQIVNNYRSLFAQHGVDSTADITCLGVNANFFPSEMITQSCTTGQTSTYPQTPWSNGYAEVNSSQALQGIIVTYYNLPQTACNNLANTATTSPDLIGENINGTSETVTPAVPPYTSVQISSLCLTGSTNYVALTYKGR